MADDLNEVVLEDGYESSGEESDRELQVALKEGLLKPGLTVVAATRRPAINNEAGLRAKTERLRAPLEWVERLDWTATRLPVAAAGQSTAAAQCDSDNDFEREVSFYKQAQECVAAALSRLHGLRVPTRRPSEYYAEMLKTDKHMGKVREYLLQIQQAKERQEAARRLREERKFASSVQKQVVAGRQAERRQLADALQRHRKGAPGQLDALLGEGGGGAKHKAAKSASRAFRDEKFGFGGQKKRSKQNTADSAAAQIAPFRLKTAKSRRTPKKQQKSKKKKGRKV